MAEIFGGMPLISTRRHCPQHSFYLDCLSRYGFVKTSGCEVDTLSILDEAQPIRPLAVVLVTETTTIEKNFHKIKRLFNYESLDPTAQNTVQKDKKKLSIYAKKQH